MNPAVRLTHKKEVYNLCVKLLAVRIEVCQLAISSAQQASNHEEKSSAGDKFETSRAMNHLEKEMYSKQLQSNIQEQAALQSIGFDQVHEKVGPGSYIVCGEFDVFVAAGLGKITYKDRLIYLVSPQAPLAAMIKNKTRGDNFILNNREETILQVY